MMREVNLRLTEQDVFQLKAIINNEGYPEGTTIEKCLYGMIGTFVLKYYPNTPEFKKSVEMVE